MSGDVCRCGAYDLWNGSVVCWVCAEIVVNWDADTFGPLPAAALPGHEGQTTLSHPVIQCECAGIPPTIIVLPVGCVPVDITKYVGGLPPAAADEGRQL